MILGFSIIICCYNSEDKIFETLQSISKLIIPDNFKLEVVLIDNNCTDSTIQIANKFYANGSKFSLKIVKEKRSGLTFARVKGIKISSYDFLIFCDDDNWLDKDYLLFVNENFSNPSCKIVGGFGIAKSDIDLPDWFMEVDGYGYAVGKHARKNGSNQMINGAGLAIKKDSATNYSEKISSLLLSDRKINSLSSGGDNELCIVTGLDHVYFDERLFYYHYIPAIRLSVSYYEKLNISFGKAEAVLFYYKIAKYNVWSGFFLLLKTIFKNFRKVNYFYLLRNESFKNRILFIFFKSYAFNLLFSIPYFLNFRKRAIMNLNNA